VTERLQTRDDFYFHALDRVRRLTLVLGVSALVAAGVFFGWRIAMGFALGSVIAALNFYWLEKIVAGVAELSTGAKPSMSSRGVVGRFLVRYFLMALVAFVILAVSRESLYGLFAGLFLPVAAILCEAVHMTYLALVRGV
jgi:uncharacterized membrane protein